MLGIEPTEEEQLLRESVDRLVERDYGFKKRLQAAKTQSGFRPEIWAMFAELGWLGLLLPESAGGFGGGARHSAILMEAFGRALVTEPFLASVVMSGSAISLAGGDARAESLLTDLVDGSRLMSLAYAEPASRYDVNVVATRAEQNDAGWVIVGRKSVVLNGDSADMFVVSARTAGEDADVEGISLFTVSADQKGLAVRGYATNDGGRAAELSFTNVEVAKDALLGTQGSAYSVLEKTIDRAAVAVAAEALGIMTVLNDLTLEYSKTRQQFGQPIGKNQALQHRLVDMFVALEESPFLVSGLHG